MKGSGDKPSETPTPPNRSTVILLLGTIADTTWRMFAPTLGGLALGFWADSAWHSEPLGALAGLLIGIVVTAFLIKQQLQEIST